MRRNSSSFVATMAAMLGGGVDIFSQPYSSNHKFRHKKDWTAEYEEFKLIAAGKSKLNAAPRREHAHKMRNCIKTVLHSNAKQQHIETEDLLFLFHDGSTVEVIDHMPSTSNFSVRFQPEDTVQECANINQVSVLLMEHLMKVSGSCLEDLF
jgi:hypothetical protein